MKISLNKKKLTDIAFIVPSLAGVSIFVLIPFIDVLRRSFTNVSGTQFVFFSNYITIFQNAAFRLAFSNTIKFMVICIPILMIFSLLIAVFLNAGIRGANYLKTGISGAHGDPGGFGCADLAAFVSQNGYFSGLLHMFGMQSQDWMDTGFAFWILVFSYVWKNLGYNVVLWMAGLTAIPDTLYEAARADGANNIQCFRYITMPNLMSTLYTITVLAFLNSFKVFREAYLVAGDYPHESMYLLQHLFNNWFRELSLDKMSAAAVVIALLILVLILGLQRSWDRED